MRKVWSIRNILHLLRSEEPEDVSAVLTSTSNDLSGKAEQCKADDYLEKPFDLDHMIDVVKKTLNRLKGACLRATGAR